MNDIEEIDVCLNRVMVSVLVYADDLVLLAQIEAGLQRVINALHSFCLENNLTVNIGESKLMYVSKRKPANLTVIVYDLQPLQWVNSFKYLELHFLDQII